jgi:hypothetical protein
MSTPPDLQVLTAEQLERLLERVREVRERRAAQPKGPAPVYDEAYYEFMDWLMADERYTIPKGEPWA